MYLSFGYDGDQTNSDNLYSKSLSSMHSAQHIRHSLQVYLCLQPWGFFFKEEGFSLHYSVSQYNQKGDRVVILLGLCRLTAICCFNLLYILICNCHFFLLAILVWVTSNLNLGRSKVCTDLPSEIPPGMLLLLLL